MGRPEAKEAPGASHMLTHGAMHGHHLCMGMRAQRSRGSHPNACAHACHMLLHAAAPRGSSPEPQPQPLTSAPTCGPPKAHSTCPRGKRTQYGKSGGAPAACCCGSRPGSRSSAPRASACVEQQHGPSLLGLAAHTYVQASGLRACLVQCRAPPQAQQCAVQAQMQARECSAAARMRQNVPTAEKAV